jgi:hypothetical protein
MPTYQCPRCNYSTNRVSNLKVHLSKTIICEPINENISVEQICERLHIVLDNDTSKCCMYCKKAYSSRSGLEYHEQRCNDRPREPTIESLQEVILNMENEIEQLREEAALVAQTHTYNNINNDNSHHVHIHISGLEVPSITMSN